MIDPDERKSRVLVFLWFRITGDGRRCPTLGFSARSVFEAAVREDGALGEVPDFERPLARMRKEAERVHRVFRSTAAMKKNAFLWNSCPQDEKHF